MGDEWSCEREGRELIRGVGGGGRAGGDKTILNTERNNRANIAYNNTVHNTQYSVGNTNEVEQGLNMYQHSGSKEGEVVS